jgi:hypothetical protein
MTIGQSTTIISRSASRTSGKGSSIQGSQSILYERPCIVVTTAAIDRPSTDKCHRRYLRLQLVVVGDRWITHRQRCLFIIYFKNRSAVSMRRTFFFWSFYMYILIDREWDRKRNLYWKWTYAKYTNTYINALKIYA